MIIEKLATDKSAIPRREPRLAAKECHYYAWLLIFTHLRSRLLGGIIVAIIMTPLRGF